MDYKTVQKWNVFMTNNEGTKIYLIQHGDSLAKEVDPNRPLSEKGKQDINHLATFLKNLNLSVDLIIHSGKLRAAQTAELLGLAFQPRTPIQSQAGLEPLDDPTPLANELKSWSHNTVFVGHLPFMEKLSSLLLAGEEKKILAFEPGTLICLERNNENIWTLLWMLRPQLFLWPV